MPPRTLDSQALALSTAPDPDHALIVRGETLAELDRGVSPALNQYDARPDMPPDQLTPVRTRVMRSGTETASDRPPNAVRTRVLADGPFIEGNDRPANAARRRGFHTVLLGGLLAVRGSRTNEDAARVRVLGLVNSPSASHHDLPTWLPGAPHVG